jgi:plastocyanin
LKNLFCNSFFTFIFFLMASGITLSQTTHDVTVQDFTFTPQTLTITVGDAVKWTNIQGIHNVVADDNSFTSGPPAPAPWEFIHTFTIAGSNPYYCEPHGGPGGQGMSGVITVQNPVGVPADDFIAGKFELNQNYPNPFNPATKIGFRIADFPSELRPAGTSGFVSLKVFDVLGNEVATLVNEYKPAGVYEVEFDAQGLPSGMYLYKLQAGSFVETKKMILLK